MIKRFGALVRIGFQKDSFDRTKRIFASDCCKHAKQTWSCCVCGAVADTNRNRGTNSVINWAFLCGKISRSHARHIPKRIPSQHLSKLKRDIKSRDFLRIHQWSSGAAATKIFLRGIHGDSVIDCVQDKLGGVDIGWRFFHEFALNWIRRARIGLRVRGRDRWNLIPTIRIAGIVTSGMRRRKSKVCARSLQDSQASLVINLRLHSGLLQRRWTSMKTRSLR